MEEAYYEREYWNVYSSDWETYFTEKEVDFLYENNVKIYLEGTAKIRKEKVVQFQGLIIVDLENYSFTIDIPESIEFIQVTRTILQEVDHYLHC